MSERSPARPSDPMLLRFAAPIPPARSARATRYDTARGISQVHQDGRWMDRLDSSDEDPPTTTFTRVNRETTDDD